MNCHAERVEALYTTERSRPDPLILLPALGCFPSAVQLHPPPATFDDPHEQDADVSRFTLTARGRRTSALGKHPSAGWELPWRGKSGGTQRSRSTGTSDRASPADPRLL